MTSGAPFDRFLKHSRAQRQLLPHPFTTIFYGPAVLAALARASYCALRFMHPDDLVTTLHSLARLNVAPASNLSKPITLAIAAALPDLSAAQIVQVVDAEHNLKFGTPVNFFRMHLLKAFMRRPLSPAANFHTVVSYLEILLQQTEQHATRGRSSSLGSGLHVYAVLTWLSQLPAGVSSCGGPGQQLPPPPPLDVIATANNLLLVLKPLWDVYLETAQLVVHSNGGGGLAALVVLPEVLVHRLIAALPWCTSLALSVLASMPRPSEWIPAHLMESFGAAVQRAVHATPPSVLHTSIGVLLCHVGVRYATHPRTRMQLRLPPLSPVPLATPVRRDGAPTPSCLGDCAMQSTQDLHATALGVVQQHVRRGDTISLLRLMHAKAIPSCLYFQCRDLMACIPPNSDAAAHHHEFRSGAIAVDILSFCRSALEPFLLVRPSPPLLVGVDEGCRQKQPPSGIKGAWESVVQLTFVLRARHLSASSAASVQPATMASALREVRALLLAAAHVSSRQHCDRHVDMVREQLSGLLCILGQSLSLDCATKACLSHLLLEYSYYPTAFVGATAPARLRSLLSYTPTADTGIVLDLIGSAAARCTSTDSCADVLVPDGIGTTTAVICRRYPLCELASVPGFDATLVAAFHQLSILEALFVVEAFAALGASHPPVSLRLLRIATIYFNVHMRRAEHSVERTGRREGREDWNRKGGALFANYGGDKGVEERRLHTAAPVFDIMHFMDAASVRRCATAMYRLSAHYRKACNELQDRSSSNNSNSALDEVSQFFASKEWNALCSKVQQHLGVPLGASSSEAEEPPGRFNGWSTHHSCGSIVKTPRGASIPPPPPPPCPIAPHTDTYRRVVNTTN